MASQRRVPSVTLLAQAAIGAIVLPVAVDIALDFRRPELSVLHSAESDV